MKVNHNHNMEDVCDCNCTYYWHILSTGGACKGKWQDAGCQCDRFVLSYKIFKDITTKEGTL